MGSRTSKPRFFATPEKFRAWLEKNAATADELIVGYYKVHTGKPSMTWSESVDEALCFGWIDGIRRRIDDEAYAIRFTPRRPTSHWSAVNVAKIEKLTKEGRMRDAGREAFAHWQKKGLAGYTYERPGTAELTAAETREFKGNKAAWAYFSDAPPGYRKTVLHWISSAKKDETRARRLAKLIDACVRGERL